MGFPNLFFPEPGATLESLLKKACKDRSAVPDFYRELLEGELYILGEAKGPGQVSGDGERIIEGGSIQFFVFDIEGENQICAYTSLKVLTQCIDQEMTYVRMKARDFLDMLGAGSIFVLNAGAEYGKKFTGPEIEDLRAGKIFEPLEAFKIKAGEKILLGQPAKPPSKTLEAMQAYFSSHPEIQSAYLGQVFYVEGKEPPHCVIGLRLRDSCRSFREVAKDLGLIAQDLNEAPLIDFVNLSEQSTITDYLVKETHPIFKAA